MILEARLSPEEIIQLRYFGRNNSLTQGTPQDASVKCPTRLKFPKEVKKPLKVKRMCHGGTKHQQTTRMKYSTQRRTRIRTISPFGNQKFPEGGERPADGDITGVPSEKKERFASLRDLLREEEKFFSKKPNVPYASDKDSKFFFSRNLIIIGSIIPKK